MQPHTDLADDITAFVSDALDGFVTRFCPEDRLPRVLAGVPVGSTTTVALLYLYGLARACGVDSVAGRSLDDRCRALLPLVKGDQIEGCHSFRLGEALLSAGADFADNPLLREQSEETRTELLQGMDATDIFDQESGELTPGPNHRWAVLARAEVARSQLGLLEEPLTMRAALTKVQDLLRDNPMSFWDDSPAGGGRFDSVGCEVLLHCEAFVDLLAPGAFRAAQNAADRLLNLAALEEGGFVAWGRGTGSRSLTTRLQLAALLLKNDACRTPGRTLALAQDAFDQFVSEWWGDDTLLSQRDTTLLEASLDALASLLEAAVLLRKAPAAVSSDPDEELYPELDAFLRFAPNRGACWFFKNPHWRLQWPLVGGVTAASMAAPTHPILLPQPVNGSMGCGVPHAVYDGETYFPQACPYGVDHHPNGISFSQRGLGRDSEVHVTGLSRAFTRKVEANIYGNTLQVRERWSFPAELPELLWFHLPVGDVPLEISWTCSSEHRICVVDVAGREAWRSAWGEIKQLHQLEITPSAEMHLSYAVTPLA